MRGESTNTQVGFLDLNWNHFQPKLAFGFENQD
jgi:hypothetical protein